jgi:uncharacterized protein YggT (Ycf19 family)
MIKILILISLLRFYFVLYMYFNWYVKDKKKRKFTTLIDNQVIETLAVIKSSAQAVTPFKMQSILLKQNLKNLSNLNSQRWPIVWL